LSTETVFAMCCALTNSGQALEHERLAEKLYW